MSSSGCGPVWINRRVIVASGVAVLLAGASVAQAQTAGAVTPRATAQVQDRQPGQDAQPDPAKDPFYAMGSQGMILVFVKADKAADFEAVMAKIKEAVAKPDKDDDPAELKAKRANWRKQAAGWSVLKVAEPNPNGTLTYIWSLDPAVPNTKYDPTDILYSNMERADADAIFSKLTGALAGANKWTITRLLDMKSGG